MKYLKQSTAATVHVGPFVDYSDGVTPETGLAAGTVDEIGVYKDSATSLTDISGTTTFTSRAGGIYTATLSTSDTGTLGHLRLFVRDDSVCLPVWEDFMVLPAAVYDSLVAGTDTLPADVQQIDGQDTDGNNATLNLKQLNISNSTGSAIIAVSTGSDGSGMYLSGDGAGHGLFATAEQEGGSGSGIKALGAGAGHGVHAESEATGHGVYAYGGGTSGDGIHAEAQTSGDGLQAVGATNGAGINADGAGTGSGIEASGGSTSGSGVYAIGGGDSGHGIHAEGDGTGHGLHAVGDSSSGIGSGINAIGAANGGRGMNVEAQADNYDGLRVFGDGSGHGIHALADASSGTGHGILSEGGGTSGDGIKATATSGNGIYGVGADQGSGIRGDGTGDGAGVLAYNSDDGPGFWADGSDSSNADGAKFTGVGSGYDINGDIQGNLSGTIGGLTAAALADMFDTDSGTTYASAVAGSVVKEIADNAASTGATAAEVWGYGTRELTALDEDNTTIDLDGSTIGTVTNVTNAVDLNADQSGVTIGTVTTNTDMRGTDNALLAASAPTNFGDLAITASTGKVTVGTNDDKTGYDLNADQSGVTVGTVTDVTNEVDADVTAISGDATAADNLEAMLDGTRAKLYLSQLNIQTSGNDDAILAQAAGSGYGIKAQGGATNGHGIYSYGQGTGNGMYLISASGAGLFAYGDSHGAHFTSGNSGDGIRAVGAASGNGIFAESGDSGGHGIHAHGGDGSDGSGIYAQADTSGAGAGTGDGIKVLGATNGITSTAGNSGHAMSLTGSGSGEGLYAVGGSTGNGAQFNGGTTGNGLSLVGSGASRMALSMATDEGERYISQAAEQEMADETLSRDVSNVEDSASDDSMAQMILAAFHSATSGSTWTVKKTDDSTTFKSVTIATETDADNITGTSG